MPSFAGSWHDGAVASLDDIRTKLAVAQTHEGGGGNWSNISYEMKPPIGEAALTQLELAQGIELPDGYRDFLLTVGNGGAGPGYGLYSLEDSLEDRRDGIYSLADPFVPPTSSRDWIELRAPGMLPIYHDGCAFFGGLAVSGPARGTIWSYVEAPPGWIPYLSDSDIVGPDGEVFEMSGNDSAAYARMYDAMLLPENVQGRQTFLARYESWLDGVIGASESN